MRSELNGYERTGIMFDTFLLIFVAIDAEELLLPSKESRLKELGHMQGGWQELIVVASLIDRIPNLAGLAHTCEVSHRRGRLLHMHSFSCTQNPGRGRRGWGCAQFWVRWLMYLWHEVQNSLVQLSELTKNCQFQFVGRKRIRIKEPLVLVISKTSKNWWGLPQRTSGEPVVT